MGLLIPVRRRGVEFLDDPRTPAGVRDRAQRDVMRANLFLGGTRAVLSELRAVFSSVGASASLLDVGTGLADIPARASRVARDRGIALTTVGIDHAESLARANDRVLSYSVCGSALALPFASRSFDIVTCSQLLHHFEEEQALQVLAEMHRVARHIAIVSDLRRSWVAVAGYWLVSFVLGFHPVARHDGVVSVLRGFTTQELIHLVTTATRGRPVAVRHYIGYRITATWAPAAERGRPL